VQHVNTQLQLRGFKLRETLAHSEMQNLPMPNSLFLLPETPQVRSLSLFIQCESHVKRDYLHALSDKRSSYVHSQCKHITRRIHFLFQPSHSTRHRVRFKLNAVQESKRRNTTGN
jgi:hypothetical protein